MLESACATTDPDLMSYLRSIPDVRMRRVGFDRFKPDLYSLRHMWATRRLEAGAPPALIAKSLGHSLTELLKTYEHIDFQQEGVIRSVWQTNTPDEFRNMESWWQIQPNSVDPCHQAIGDYCGRLQQLGGESSSQRSVGSTSRLLLWLLAYVAGRHKLAIVPITGSGIAMPAWCKVVYARVELLRVEGTGH